MKTVLLLLSITFCNFVFCQTNQIEKVNHLLDTETYYNIELDYKSNLTLPDSVKQKLISTLCGKVPQKIADSILSIPKQLKEHYLEYSQKKCKKDSACALETYNTFCQDWYNNEYKRLYDYYKVNKTVVLAIGSWNIKEAIPILAKGINDTKYDQPSVLMALAKLGNDSIKQILIERYTLANVLANSPLDTIDNNAPLYEIEFPWSDYDGLKTAVYLKNKEMILNILDLIYIKGIGMQSIGDDEFYLPVVSSFLEGFECYKYFYSVPNHHVLLKICYDYTYALGVYENKKPTKKEIKSKEKLLSTEYRTKVRNQIRDWIIENVNFEDEQIK